MLSSSTTDSNCLRGGSHPTILVVLASIGFVTSVANALTPIDSADISPDVTIILDSQTIDAADVAADDLVGGSVSIVSLGSLPAGSDVSAYHDLGGGVYLFAFDTTVTLTGGLLAQPGDVVRYDGTTYSIEFDASAQSVPGGAYVDAVSMSNGGNLVLSFDTTVTLGSNTYADEDLAEFDGVVFSPFFSGSSAGLDSALDLDAAHVFAINGNLALSFDSSGNIGGIYFDDEDVLEYDASGPTWEMAWDASAERSAWGNGVDATAVYFVPEPGPTASLVAGAAMLFILKRRRDTAKG